MPNCSVKEIDSTIDSGGIAAVSHISLLSNSTSVSDKLLEIVRNLPVDQHVAPELPGKWTLRAENSKVRNKKRGHKKCKD